MDYRAYVNLNLYRIFYYVAKEKSITGAAKRLYISQPAISKSLKKLEEELHVNLFSRNLNGVELTEEGKILFTYVEKALKNITAAENALNIYKNIPVESEKTWDYLN